MGAVSGRVPGGVGQQVAQDLDDAQPVGHHGGKIGGQFDPQVAASPAAREGGAGLIQQRGHGGRFGTDPQGAGLDAGHVQQIVYQPAHVVGLPVDDADERADHLRGGQHGRVAQQGGGGALDGGQRGAQLVTDHGQELGPQPLHILQRRQVLQGHHEGVRPAGPVGGDGRRVDQGGDRASAGHLDDDLLGAHRLPGAQRPGQGDLFEGHLPAVAAPEGQDPEQVLQGLVRLPQAVDDPVRLPVGRHQASRPRVEHDYAHRRGVDQGLQVGADPLLVPVAAGVGKDQRRLRGEQDQGVLVFPGELLAAFLGGQAEVADPLLPEADRRPQKGDDRIHRQGRPEPGQAQGPDMAQQVR